MPRHPRVRAAASTPSSPGSSSCHGRDAADRGKRAALGRAVDAATDVDGVLVTVRRRKTKQEVATRDVRFVKGGGASSGDSGVGAVPWLNGLGDRRWGGKDGARSSLKAVLAVTDLDCGGGRQSLTAAVSRRLSPSSSVMPSVLRGCVRAPPRAPRAGRGVRPPAAGADAVRGPRFGVRFTRGRRGPVQSRRKSRQPARRPLPPARPRRRGRCLTASRGGPAALRIGLRRCGRWLAGGGRTAGRNSRQPPWLTTPAAGKLLDEVLSRRCDEVTGFGRPSTSRPRRVRGTKTRSDGCGLGGTAVDLRVDPAAPAAAHDRPATTCSSGDSHAPGLACGPRVFIYRVGTSPK